MLDIVDVYSRWSMSSDIHPFHIYAFSKKSFRIMFWLLQWVLEYLLFTTINTEFKCQQSYQELHKYSIVDYMFQLSALSTI